MGPKSNCAEPADLHDLAVALGKREGRKRVPPTSRLHELAAADLLCCQEALRSRQSTGHGPVDLAARLNTAPTTS